ncbi:MAG TPA: hypothetical protein DDW52_06075 [Planctomycetaceae bacterium]|nr:hypothetical protein [Planctomycetaceae bacterium]
MNVHDKRTEQQEAKIRSLRESLLRPVADKFGFPLGKQRGAIGTPTVLCLGNHSSGKSTFVNYLAGNKIQDTGVAPIDDGFTLITYGEQVSDRDGRAVVADPNLPYHDLEQFGKGLLDHLKLKRRPESALKNLCIIDSPGMIDHAGSSTDDARGYDFEGVVRLLAESSDLIVFFFDPDKPGTTGESLQTFTRALDNVMYKVLIVFNKVDQFADVRDFARTYGSLCWNLSRIIRTKDMPHIYCTFVPNAAKQNGHFDLSDFEQSTKELLQQIDGVDTRRKTNLVSSLLDSARQLRMHASVSRKVGWRLMQEKLGLGLIAGVLLVLGVWLAWTGRENSYWLTGGIVLALAGIGIGVAFKSIMAMRLNHHVELLGKYFREEYSGQMMKQQNTRYLEGLWESVRERTEHFLRNSKGIFAVPFSPLWTHKFHKLDKAIEHEIPELLQDLSHNGDNAA